MSLITDIFRQNSQPNPQLANALREKIHNGFPNLSSFLHELIQNADDLASIGEPLIEFQLTENQLRVEHEGKPFDAEDVRAICTFADASLEHKGGVESKTGYKNIGFKAVFKRAYRVAIYSGDFQFAFNERNESWKGKPEDYTWQIAPLMIKNPLSKWAKKRTVFIFNLRDGQATAVQQGLQELLSRPQDILFLKSITKISLQFQGQIHEIKKVQDQLTVNGSSHSVWNRERFTVAIPPAIQQFLQELPLEACPKRLKGKKVTEIILGYQLNKGTLTPCADARLYCTLPTGVLTGLPFVVNADFLLDSSRQQLMDYPWNHFLIKTIATANGQHVKQLLQDTRLCSRALSVLAPKSNPVLTEAFRVDYLRQRSQFLLQNPIIPSLKGDFLFLDRCSCDASGFYRALPELAPRDLAHPSISYKELEVHQESPSTLQLDHIIARLETLMKENTNGETCRNILLFFSAQNLNLDQIKALKQQKCIPTLHHGLVSLSELYLNHTAQDLLPFLPFPTPQQHIVTAEVAKWMTVTLSIKALTFREIVSFFAKNLEHPLLKVEKNNVALMELLFRAYRQRRLDKGDLKQLKGILLIAKDGTPVPSDRLYLGTHFQPKFPLEKSLPKETTLFLHEAYPSELAKEFVETLGVYSDCQLLFFKWSIGVRELRRIPHSYMDQYLTASLNWGSKKGRATTDNDSVSPIVFFPYLEQIPASAVLYQHFWEQIHQHAGTILQEYRVETFHDYGYKPAYRENSLTYFQRLFQQVPLIRSTKGGFACAKDLYSSSLKKHFGSLIPAADLPVVLSKEMEAFLGMRQTLSLVECYTFLALLETNFDFDRYKIVLQHLVQNIEKGEKDKRPVRLLDTTNQWRPTKELRFLDSEHLQVPQETAGWIKRVLPIAEMNVLATFFQIPIHVPAGADISQKGKEDSVFKDELFKKLPRLAYHYHDFRGGKEDLKQVMQTLLVRFHALSFVLIDEEEGAQQAVLLEQTFYYYPNWATDLRHISNELAAHFGFEADNVTDFHTALTNTHPPRGDKAEKIARLTQYLDELKVAPLPEKEEAPPSPAGSPPQTPVKQVASRVNLCDPQQYQDSPQPPPLAPRVPPAPVLNFGIQPLPEAKSPTDKGTPKQEPKEPMDDADKKRIGNWAEERVFVWLKDTYLKKGYREVNKVDQIGQCQLQKGDKTCTIQWNNHPELVKGRVHDDSSAHYDIQLAKTKGTELQPLIKFEVKGTGKPEVNFTLTAGEWKEYLRDKEHFRIVVVTEVGKDLPFNKQIHPLADLLTLLASKTLEPINAMHFYVTPQ